MKLNLGSGETKLEGFTNVDMEEKTKPDIVCDIRKSTLPLRNETCEEVWAIHSIEHIEDRYWDHVFNEIFRVLVPNGRLVLAYPEFDICSDHYIKNYKGIKDFWKATLYGRQLYPGDYHVTAVRSPDLEQFLLRHGFNEFRHKPQPGDEYYTIAEARKFAMITKEDVLRKEIFA